MHRHFENYNKNLISNARRLRREMTDAERKVWHGLRNNQIGIVKGGETVQSKDIDALMGAMQKHECALGVFLTAAEPTKPMLQTVAASGFVKVPGFEFPKVQIITLKEFFAGKRPKLPATNVTFKAAQHSGKKAKGQMDLEM